LSYYEWIHSLSPMEVWVMAGMMNVILWFLLAMPLFYRAFFTPVSQATFYDQMRASPRMAVVTLIFHFVFGTVMFFPGIFALFLACVGCGVQLVMLAFFNNRKPS